MADLALATATLSAEKFTGNSPELMLAFWQSNEFISAPGARFIPPGGLSP